MQEPVAVGPRVNGCPFAMPAIPSTDTVAFYCRVPGGGVRMPTRDERVRYCASGRFEECPVVRRHVRD